jgi:hypothetical protein
MISTVERYVTVAALCMKHVMGMSSVQWAAACYTNAHQKTILHGCVVVSACLLQCLQPWLTVHALLLVYKHTVTSTGCACFAVSLLHTAYSSALPARTSNKCIRNINNMA